MENRWYRCKVLSINPHLGPGYESKKAYVRKGYKGNVSVFNGRFAIRSLNKNNARSCLKIIERLSEKDSQDIENRLQWELNR